MKYLSLILIITNLAFSNDIVIPSLTIRGLETFESKNISTYLVSAKVNAFSKKKTINAVIKKTSITKIKTPDLILKQVTLPRSVAKSYAPNYVLIVIHTQQDYAINKNVKAPLFEKVVNLDTDNQVAPTLANRKFNKILLLPVTGLSDNPIISL